MRLRVDSTADDIDLPNRGPNFVDCGAAQPRSPVNALSASIGVLLVLVPLVYGEIGTSFTGTTPPI